MSTRGHRLTLALILLLAGGAGLAAYAAPGTAGSSRDETPNDRELTALKRQVEFQNKELALARQRHADLRRAVLQAVATLKARSKDGSNDTLIASLERALAASASTGAAVTALDEKPAPAAAANPGPSATPPAGTPSNTVAGTNTNAAAAPGPAAAPMPAAFHVGAFAFSKVAFAATPDGAVCTGRITNQSLATHNEVTTPGFVLTTFDEKGNPLQSATFYVAFSENDQTKTFSVPLAKLPPTGRFKIEAEPKPEN